MELQEGFKEFWRLLEEEEEFLITTHINPDLDGICSALAFSYVLNRLKKQFTIVSEPPPRNAKFLPERSLITLQDDWKGASGKEVLIVFDANNLSRVPEKVRNHADKFRCTVIFDHHYLEESRSRFPNEKLVLVDPLAASTTLLLYRFLHFVGFELTESLATLLLTGLYFDTGGFKFENTKAEVFEVAAALTKAGAKPSFIAREIFENIPWEEVLALKRVIDRIEFLNDRKIAVSYLSSRDFEELGLQYVEYLSNFLRSIEGVKVAALLKEKVPGEIGVSLRSRAPVEVLEFAQAMGGGGHKYASGFRVKGVKLEEFLKEFKKKLKEYYEKV